MVTCLFFFIMSNSKIRILKPYIWVIIATLFISLSGPLGRYAQLDPPFVIFIRSVLGVLFLGVIQFAFLKEPVRIPVRDKSLLFSGVIMCVHWVLFFYSLHYSTVAIAAVSVFTYPMQTILLEAIIRRIKIEKVHLILSVFVVAGVVLLNPEFRLNHQYSLGIFFGFISGTLLAIRNIYSKVLLVRYSPNITYFTQVAVSAVLLIPFAWRETWQTTMDNIIPLVLLGLLTTTLGHLLMMKSLKHFSAGEVGLLISGQPVSAIIIAWLLLGERPEGLVLTGAAIILVVVMLSFRQIRAEKSKLR